MFDPVRFVLSFLAAFGIGAVGYRRGSLKGDGWAAAVVVGTLTAGVGGWGWGILVVVFFVTSSALGRVGRQRKAGFAAEQWEKGDRRDWGQVAANGGVVSMLALAYALLPHPALWYAAVGALATVNGDTWATELGVLSRAQPRLITTGRQVAPGTSGGVTLLGWAAALAGAVLIGVVAALVAPVPNGAIVSVVAALIGGAAGVAADSMLGATVQAIRWCPHCQKQTERAIHDCGTPTTFKRGWRWLHNDAVNLLASLLGGALASAVALVG
jgi:uncharacterized protein (TIGR00297 family)